VRTVCVYGQGIVHVFWPLQANDVKKDDDACGLRGSCRFLWVLAMWGTNKGRRSLIVLYGFFQCAHHNALDVSWSQDTKTNLFVDMDGLEVDRPDR
jgi:hypothetical protein